MPLQRKSNETIRLRRLRIAAGAVAIAACLPYAGLKVAWLAGASVGAATAEGAAELHDERHTVGNGLTLLIAALAVLLALALTHPRGRRLPPALVLLPVWLGTGLLAPIALGLPLGLVAQAVAGGSPAPAGNGLEGWVYAVVYGGFMVQAVALAVAFVLYARVRWAALLPLGMPEGGGRQRSLAWAAAAAAVLYAATNVGWTAAGESLAAPPGFETATQRSLLLSTGVLVLAGAIAVLRTGARRRIAWLAFAWVGSASAFASGLSHVTLASDAGLPASTALLLAVGAVSGVLMGAAAVLARPGRALRH